ncbi:MAG TPA: phosphotransferase [Anaerolineales bacterium]|nr:phosphotransferase [Anaerolineales bacterium]
MPDQSQLPWHDPDWMEQAHQWIRAETTRRHIRIMGDIEQPHLYPWSTVLHVPTDEGKLFFKATAPETLYEVPLTEMLSNWYPDCMPELIAVDTRRGWMLMRDGGEQLRQSIRPTRDISLWTPIIPIYADVQVGAAGQIAEILVAGLPDYRLVVLPALYAKLLTDRESLMIDQERGVTASEWRQLQDMVLRFEWLCSELSAYGIPESIDHGDFHDGNVLVRNGRITFLDWGDASITHPFVSLRTFFVSIENSLKLDDYSFTPEMAALLDEYLEPWQKFGSKDELLTTYRLSRPVASIVKAFRWEESISRMQGSIREEYAWIVPELLREFIYHEKKLSE